VFNKDSIEISVAIRIQKAQYAKLHGSAVAFGVKLFAWPVRCWDLYRHGSCSFEFVQQEIIGQATHDMADAHVLA